MLFCNVKNDSCYSMIYPLKSLFSIFQLFAIKHSFKRLLNHEITVISGTTKIKQNLQQ